MKKRILIVSFISLLTGCRPSLHVFNTTNAPCLTQKNEIKVNAYGNLEHAEVQVAYAPTSNLGVMANAYSAVGRSSTGTGLVEAAAGYHTNYLNDWNFDVYGGAGYGERMYTQDADQGPLYSAFYGDYYFNLHTFYSKYFVQPSLFLKKEKMEFAASLQIGYYNFSHVHYRMVTASTSSNPTSQTINYNYQNVGFVSYCPALTWRFGFRNVKFIAQIATNVRPEDPFSKDITKYLSFYSRVAELNFGLQFHFGNQFTSKISIS